MPHRFIKQCVEAFRRAQILTRENGSSAYGGRLFAQKIFLSGIRVVVLVLVPVRTAVPVLRRSSYNSVGTRIQCGGTLSPLPTGRDSLGTGGDVQWHGLTVFLGGDPGRTVDSLLPSELAGGLYGCTAGLRNKSGGGSSSVLGIWHICVSCAVRR